MSATIIALSSGAASPFDAIKRTRDDGTEFWSARALMPLLGYGEKWSKPIGWEPSAEYLERFKTSKWIEPDTSKWFKSRSSAASRVKLLEDAGYRAVVQKSAPVEWPDGDGKSVWTSRKPSVSSLTTP